MSIVGVDDDIGPLDYFSFINVENTEPIPCWEFDGDIEPMEDYDCFPKQQNPYLLCSSCGEIASKKCGSCHLEVYCDRACQKKHWNIHKHECSNRILDICQTCAKKTDESRKQCHCGALFCDENCFQRAPKRHANICRPFSFVVESRLLPVIVNFNYCQVCETHPSALFSCACLQRRYCSPKCRNKDRQDHKRICILNTQNLALILGVVPHAAKPMLMSVLTQWIPIKPLSMLIIDYLGGFKQYEFSVEPSFWLGRHIFVNEDLNFTIGHIDYDDKSNTVTVRPFKGSNTLIQLRLKRVDSPDYLGIPRCGIDIHGTMNSSLFLTMYRHNTAFLDHIVLVGPLD